MSTPPDQPTVIYQLGVQGRYCSTVTHAQRKKSTYYDNLLGDAFSNLFLEACDFTIERWNISKVSEPASQGV